MKKERTSVLTSREQEVIRLASLGYTNKQIAKQLKISPKTVERHKENMMNKLHLEEQHELIQFALKNNRSEEHTSELQSRFDLVCRLLLEKKKNILLTSDILSS